MIENDIHNLPVLVLYKVYD